MKTEKEDKQTKDKRKDSQKSDKPYNNLTEFLLYKNVKKLSLIIYIMIFLVALIGGILSFFSPCIFPIIPVYMTFFAGVSLSEIKNSTGIKRRLILKSVLFVLGFSLAFSILGASSSALGNFLRAFKREVMILAGIIILIFGLHLIGIIRIPFLLEEKRLDVSKISKKFPDFAFPFVAGFLFAFGWTPCIGPILAGILSIAASSENILEGITLLFVFSLGIGIPFIISAILISTLISYMQKVKKIFRTVEIASGVLLILLSPIFIFNKLDLIRINFKSLEEILNIDPKKFNLYKVNSTAKNSVKKDTDIIKSIIEKIDYIEPVNDIPKRKTDFIIVNLWATYCPPCKKEIPSFNLAVKKFEELSIIGISVDDKPEDIKKFEYEIGGIEFPVFLQKDIIGEFEPHSLPESYFFYKGKYIGKISGIVEFEEIEKFMKKDFSFIDEQ
jgi:cytochrome c-type biogenesis protein